MLTELVVGLLAQHPAFTTFLVVTGFLRAVNKPTFALIQKVVDTTATDADDKWWKKARESKAMSSVLWVLDWTTSIKLPK